MKMEALELLRCPACRGRLQFQPAGDQEAIEDGDLTCSGCSGHWPVRSGIPELVFPHELKGEELRSRRLWDRVAPFWGAIGAATNIIRGVDDARERHGLIDRLELPSGGAVLETAAGAGHNLAIIAEQAGERVSVFGVDLSPRMLQRAQRRFSNISIPPALILGNTVFLPFADRAFDSLLDGFGMKYYSDKGRAMEEMLRVVKPGGKVVITELGLPAGKRRTPRQRLLKLWIPGFDEPPPEDRVPVQAENVIVDWDGPETVYVLEFRKPARHFDQTA